MNLLKTREELLFLIENKRVEMVLEAERSGLLSHQTLKRSKELDELLNLHNQLTEISN
ncbi:aspartyl-phosphate phosphatase Spo0E family protein [Bacillus sp. DNRA2]|uniref:aspartyl-phosphate phosphatase Spo0E family protein n=1 Tax=Bacillus sp. DNRA2 TaxID=2723053 RepID=UPI00145D47BE|nr:aspartyl-phosphate phosphatase Spo0E family protein [Bacillus sp. DNRA2]NMD71893.1 aspartyl-phosphate phosphatase Spo0E family protein [Bacillus sp. DNRA2]